MRRLLPLLVVGFACALAAPAGAAPITIKKSIWGPVTLDGVSQFPIYADLGVGLYQYTVRWDDVAPRRPDDPANPNDPAYRWPDALDFAVSQAQQYGMQVSVMLIGAPGWANGGRDSRWAPDD